MKFYIETEIGDIPNLSNIRYDNGMPTCLSADRDMRDLMRLVYTHYGGYRR